MVIVVGKHPAVFIQEREMIVSLDGLKFINTPLSQITDVNGLGPLVRAIVSRGLQKLTQFGIPFSMSVSIERDAEDENWSYAFVKIMIDGKYSDMLLNEVVRYAYEGMDPSDFLNLARELGRNNEAMIRTAVGRAYYASFLTARNAMAIDEKKPEVHRMVLSMLYRKNPVIANKMHYLRRQRNIADYDTELVMVADDANKAVKLAGEIMVEMSV